MAKDINFGYKLPTTVNDGDEWGAILEDTIDRLVNHTHDGEDSGILSATIEKDVIIFDSSVWGAPVDTIKDGYEFTYTLPSGQSAAQKTVRDFYLITGTIAQNTNNTYSISSVTDKVKINPTIIWSKSSGSATEPDVMRIRIKDKFALDGITPMHLMMVSY